MIELATNAEIGLHKPGKQAWINLSEDLEAIVKQREQGVIEQVPDELCYQLMDPPTGTQDPSPPKPACKKNKQEESGEIAGPPSEDLNLYKEEKATTTSGGAGQEYQQREEEDPTYKLTAPIVRSLPPGPLCPRSLPVPYRFPYVPGGLLSS